MTADPADVPVGFRPGTFFDFTHKISSGTARRKL